MNNSQFRDLVKTDKTGKPGSPQDGSSAAFVPRSLGSRARSSVPMTPRSVGGHHPSKDFERQVAEHTRQQNGEPALKKFKSTYAPKGTKLAQGYQDRAKQRDDGYSEESSREKKLKELEEMVKQEKIDQATFERLREQMGIGGDLNTTHLVKGLDFKLLEKLRRGEDLNPATLKEPSEPSPDVEDELDNLLDKDAEARPKDRAEPKEEQPAPEVRSMSREEILQRLKESRIKKAAAVPPPEVALGARFRKVQAAEKTGKKKFVESVNGRRREVLIITKKNGNTKRKSRWIDPEGAPNNENATPLGMGIPAEFVAKQKALDEQEAADEEVDDIFGGVADYDPLQGLDSDSDDVEANEAKEKSADEKPAATEPGGTARNYFAGRDDAENDGAKFNSIRDDPNLMAALKRAAALRKGEQDDQQGGTDESARTDPDQTEKHKKFLARLKQEEREDARDMDLGFSESRFGDEDDEDGPIYEGEEEQPGKEKRKRGTKKRKGDKDSVADVMTVLEGRKK